MTPRTILVIPADGTPPIACEVIDEHDGELMIDDGELQWTVRKADVRNGEVPARLVFLAHN